MKVYDQAGNPLTEYDLNMGWLRDETRTVHHDAVEGVQEIGHWETVSEYPNGGKDVRWIVDVPGVAAREAWDEEIRYQVYVPYTEEELAEMQAQSGREGYGALVRRIEENEAALMELAELLAAQMGGAA